MKHDELAKYLRELADKVEGSHVSQATVSVNQKLHDYPADHPEQERSLMRLQYYTGEWSFQVSARLTEPTEKP